MAVVEIANFRLRDGADEQAFLEAEHQLRNGQIRQHPGFIKRELGKSDSGEWVMVLTWETQADAKSWGPKFMQDPAGKAFAQQLDLGSMRQNSYTIADV